MSTTSSQFGRLVEQRRRELGLRRYDLARAIRAEPRDIWRIERRGLIPRRERLDRLIKVLSGEVSDWPLDAPEPPSPPPPVPRRRYLVPPPRGYS